MITLIHGDDLTASRKFFISIKEKYHEALTFEGENINFTDLMQEIRGGGLFSENRPVFIEQLLTKKKDITERDAIIKLVNNSQTVEIYLWEGKEIDKKMLLLFKNLTNKLFKIPKGLFVFLEEIKPGNNEKMLKNFHQIIASSEPEMVFFMMIRHIRLLLGFSTLPSAEISEVKRLQPWQRQKIENQAKKFTAEHLKEIYSKLFQIELNLKTGGLSMNLVNSIDILLLSI